MAGRIPENGGNAGKDGRVESGDMGLLRSALRHLAGAPGFTAVAILSLTLGIGPTTAIFSLIDELLLRSLPVPRPDALVLLRVQHGVRGRMSHAGEGQGGIDPVTGREVGTPLSRAIFERLRSVPAPVAHVFASAPFSRVSVIAEGVPEVTATAQYVSGDYYGGLGVGPAIGRLIGVGDDTATAAPVAVISHRYWLRRFDGRADAIGRTLLVNAVPATIVGVSAAGFEGTEQVGQTVDIAVPLAHHLLFQPDRRARVEPGYWWLSVMARLAPGATAEQARGALEPAFQAAARDGWVTPDHPLADRPDDPRLLVEPGAQGQNETRRSQRMPLALLLALGLLVLGAACVNVSTLLVARADARRREFALRLAIGASRRGIVAQCVVEALILAGTAAASGATLAWAARDALRALHPFGQNPAAVLGLPLDLRVLAATAAVSIACSLAFSLLPALQASRVDLTSAFQGGPRTLGGHGRSWVVRGLLAVQVALSLVLLVSAGLFARTLSRLDTVDAGFDQRHLLRFRIDARSAGYPIDRVVAVHDRIRDAVAALPGVRGVTYSRVALLARVRQNKSFVLPDGPSRAVRGPVNTNGVAPDFFAVMRLPILRGRGFTAADRDGAPKVAIVNEAFARQQFNGESPIGRRVAFGGPAFADIVEIVGLARDARYTNLRDAPPATIYLPALQQVDGEAAFAVRAAGDPAALKPAVQAQVQAIDPALPVLDLRTEEEQIERLHASERLFARLSAFFGLTAVLLAAAGLHGLLAQAVLRRTGEFGLRLAIGATPGRVGWLILREAILLATAGALLGLGAAALLARLVATMLYGITPTDPLTYATTALLVVGIAVATSLLAARRASRVEPMVALRRA
jgi:predicted permease